MAVPNTDSFNLQDVTTEIYGDAASGRNLVSCFADANASGFDPLYEGSKNSLLNFRNYTGYLPVQYIASVSNFNTGNTLGVTIPIATLSGDLMTMITITASYVNITTAPAGWALQHSHIATNQHRIHSYTKIADGSSAGSIVSVSFDAATKHKLVEVVIARNQNASPIGQGWTNVNALTVSTSWTPSLTGVTSGSLILAWAVLSPATITTTWVSSGITLATIGTDRNPTPYVAGSNMAIAGRYYIDADGGNDNITSVIFSECSRNGYIIEIKP